MNTNINRLIAAFCITSGALGQINPASAQQPPESPQAKQVVELVDKATAELGSKGKAALDEFRRPEWRQGDVYLFGENLDGTVWINAALPKLEGTNVSGLKDANGKLFHLEMAKLIQAKGGGWVDYMWPKPGQNQPSQKWSYVKAVTLDGAPGYLGAGFYPQ
jgi:cytochrome c